MRKRHLSLRAERGMTLIEVLAAMFILSVGLAGVMTLLDGANKTTQLNNQRTGALNLAREIFEAARGVDYDLLTPAQAVAALQTKPGLAGGTPWQIERSDITYTVRLTTCTFDDPKDGLADGISVAAPGDPCPAATAVTGAPTEKNPDDFRRVDVFVDWKHAGRTRTLQQTDLIVNPSGGLGPRIISITEPTSQIGSGTSTASVPVRTTNAASVHWRAGVAEGDSGGGPVNWTASWDLGMVGTAGAVLDGTYNLSAQAFDSRGVPGDTKAATIAVNRSLPFAPTNLIGGRNQAFTQVAVDLEWDGSAERDILGYRVYRSDSTGTQLVCGTVAVPLNATRCTDPDAPAGGTLEYRVVAVDLEDLLNTNSTMREGAASDVLRLEAPGTQPDAPTGLVAAVSGGSVRLDWTASPGSPAFYRIYRDGELLEHRIARTATGDPFYVDAEWGGVSHIYRVSAVSTEFNESPLSNPATP